MRRFALSAIGIAVALTGCNRGPTNVVAPPFEPDPLPTPAAAAPPAAALAFPALELTPQQRYNDAVWAAVTSLTDRKYTEALAALEQAQHIQDTDQLRQEIARVKARLDAARTADRTIHDIQTILTDGMADEAARLAGTALREFGASEKADAIIRLKRQADALVAVSLDNPARVARFRQEADEATRAGSLRAAAVAYEQCVAAGDAAASSRLTPVRANLDRYDDARRQATELRRASGQLRESLAALKDAAAAWDTPEVRQEIDECTFALLLRRERLSVAEFETRGDVSAAIRANDRRGIGAGIPASLQPGRCRSGGESLQRPAASHRGHFRPRELPP